MSKDLVGAIILLISLGLTGCAQPTGYSKASSSLMGMRSYGYSDKRVNGGEFSVVVLGNPLTSKRRAAEIALLRAARLTEEEGRTHFVILKRKEETTESVVASSVPLFVGGVLVPIPLGEEVAQEPMVVLLIRLLPLQADYPPDALTAAEVIEQIGGNFE